MEKNNNIKYLITLLKMGMVDKQKMAIWELENLSITEQNRSIIGQMGAIKYLIKFLNMNNASQQIGAIYVLQNLAKDVNNRIIFANVNTITCLIKCMMENINPVRLATINILYYFFRILFHLYGVSTHLVNFPNIFYLLVVYILQLSYDLNQLHKIKQI